MRLLDRILNALAYARVVWPMKAAAFSMRIASACLNLLPTKPKRPPYDPNDWKRERAARLGPTLNNLPTHELANETQCEVARDHICPRYVAIPHLLAQRLRYRETNDLKNLRVAYVWPEKTEEEITKTITLLERDDRSKEESSALYKTLKKLEGAAAFALDNIHTLIAVHAENTGICSLPGHMRSTSTTYPFIMELGTKALPDILTYLKEDKGGMNIILLLMDITHESPYEPDTKSTPGIAKYDVHSTIDAWLTWGERKGYLQPPNT